MADTPHRSIRQTPGQPWVIIAPERRKRVAAFAGMPFVRAEECPFCPGHEAETPAEITFRRDTAGWTCRVVPNKYPAADGHEVIIETREHAIPFDALPLEHAASLIDVYIERYDANESAPEILVFKNEGRLAGASIPHPHSQLLALDRPSPRTLAERSARSCDWCDTPTAPERLVHGSDSFTVVAPFASNYPYELAIVPHEHEPAFTDLETRSAELARLMQQSVRALRAAAGVTDYNWVFRNAKKDFHWYLQITPRLTIPGGFEIGTGSSINVVAPESAASELRPFFQE